MIALRAPIAIDSISLQNVQHFDMHSFESDYKEYMDVKHVSFCNNQSSALHLSLKALKIRRGDNIICNITTDIRVVHTIRYFDAQPLFVDSDLKDFSIDFDSLKQVVNLNSIKKIKAIILDLPTANLSKLHQYYSFAFRHNIKLILYFNSFSYKALGIKDYDLAIFGSSDEIATIGSVVSNDYEIYSSIEILKNQAIEILEDRDIDIRNIGFEYNTNLFSLYYYNNYLSSISQSKEDLSYYYYEGLKDIPYITLQDVIEENAEFYFIKLIKNRDQIVAKFIIDGIEVGIGKSLMSMFSYYKNRYKLKITNFPNAIENYHQLLVLPYYPRLRQSDINSITTKLKELLI